MNYKLVRDYVRIQVKESTKITFLEKKLVQLPMLINVLLFVEVPSRWNPIVDITLKMLNEMSMHSRQNPLRCVLVVVLQQSLHIGEETLL